MREFDRDRRSFFAAGTAGLLLAASPGLVPVAEAHGGEDDVSAVEDMMREHGVLRRALLVYSKSAARLRRNGAGATNPLALKDTAKLFRTFGEDYHERKLEEAYVFPAVLKKGGPAAELIDILVAQHNRGREITDYILSLTGLGSIGTGDAEPLAKALESFVLMYQNHAAREDTVVFQAWKKAIPTHVMEDMGETFEKIEHEQFGDDEFDDALQQIGTIEQTLGYADLAQFTAPTPPHP